MTERLHFHFSLSCIGEGNGNPLQCSCLENPRDGGAWWAAVYGVAQSQTRLKWLSSSSSSSCQVVSDSCNSVHCNPLGSSVHGIFPGKNTGGGCRFLLQGIFPTQGSNLCLLRLLQWQADSLPLSHQGSPKGDWIDIKQGNIHYYIHHSRQRKYIIRL